MNWIAFACTCVGLLAISRKVRIGWLICAFGSVLWVALYHHDYALVCTNTAILGINVRGYLEWRK
jgi:hypothetical protein